MKKTLLTKTLIVLMTLALVVGVYSVQPNSAEAAISAGQPTVSPSGTIVVGQDFVLTATATSDSGTPAYAWSCQGVTGAPSAIPNLDIVGSNGGNSVTYKATAAGTYTIQCYVSDANDNFTTKTELSKQVTVVPMSFATSQSNDMVIGSSCTISVQNPKANATVNWSSTDASSEFVTLSNATGTSVTVTAKKATSGVVTITATDGTTTLTQPVNVVKKTGALSAKNSTITIFTDVGSYDMDQQLNYTSDKTPTWAVQSGGLPANTSINANDGTLSFANATGGTFTLRASLPASDQYSTPSPVDITVNLRQKVAITANVDTARVKTDGSTYVISASASTNVPLQASWFGANSGDSSIATVTGPSQSGSTYYWTVRGGSTVGKKTLRIETSGGTTGGTSYGYKDVTVSNTLPVPVITATVDDRTLGKGDMSHLHITVDGGTPGQDVTITRSNIRTYARNYDHHDRTYEYKKALDANCQVQFDIHPQYNGNTYYRISYSGATSVDTDTITVSGYKTMPQTGPDYTAIYVISALCLVVLAAAVTINVRKKKHEKV